MDTTPDGSEEVMLPHEVAELFRVDPKTVTRWAQQGKLRSFRTLGGTGPGHRRYYRADVEAFLNREGGQP